MLGKSLTKRKTLANRVVCASDASTLLGELGAERRGKFGRCQTRLQVMILLKLIPISICLAFDFPSSPSATGRYRGAILAKSVTGVP